jgi:hypothetical protein
METPPPPPVIDQYDALCRAHRERPTAEDLFERLRKLMAAGRTKGA